MIRESVAIGPNLVSSRSHRARPSVGARRQSACRRSGSGSIILTRRIYASWWALRSCYRLRRSFGVAEACGVDACTYIFSSIRASSLAQTRSLACSYASVRTRTATSSSSLSNLASSSASRKSVFTRTPAWRRSFERAATVTGKCRYSRAQAYLNSSTAYFVGDSDRSLGRNLFR